MKRLEEMTEPELRDLMNRCARAVQEQLGWQSQFVLLVFDDPKIAQYVSTCERKSIIEAMRECANRLEAKEDVPR